MRYYRPDDPGILELRTPRLAFFFLGSFYLAWLQLWREAFMLADETVEHHSPIHGV